MCLENALFYYGDILHQLCDIRQPTYPSRPLLSPAKINQADSTLPAIVKHALAPRIAKQYLRRLKALGLFTKCDGEFEFEFS